MLLNAASLSRAYLPKVDAGFGGKTCVELKDGASTVDQIIRSTL